MVTRRGFLGRVPAVIAGVVVAREVIAEPEAVRPVVPEGAGDMVWGDWPIIRTKGVVMVTTSTLASIHGDTYFDWEPGVRRG